MASKDAGIATVAAHVGYDRHAARQVDLAAVSVAHEVQAEPSIGCDIDQLGGVDEGDLEAVGRAAERCPRRVCVVVMDVAGPRDVDPCPSPPDAPSLVDQNADAQVFERLHHVGAVVVAEDQGSRIASLDFTGSLRDADVVISMDGRGRYMDTIASRSSLRDVIERLWRSLR